MLGISYLVRWISQPNACRRCQILHGREWTNVPSLEEVTALKDMFSHPHCKCEVDIELDVDLGVLEAW